jgi:hypothetical protein
LPAGFLTLEASTPSVGDGKGATDGDKDKNGG